MIAGIIYLVVGVTAFIGPWLIARWLGGVGSGSVSCLMNLLGTIFILLGLWNLFV